MGYIWLCLWPTLRCCNLGFVKNYKLYDLISAINFVHVQKKSCLTFFCTKLYCCTLLHLVENGMHGNPLGYIGIHQDLLGSIEIHWDKIWSNWIYLDQLNPFWSFWIYWDPFESSGIHLGSWGLWWIYRNLIGIGVNPHPPLENV